MAGDRAGRHLPSPHYLPWAGPLQGRFCQRGLTGREVVWFGYPESWLVPRLFSDHLPLPRGQSLGDYVLPLTNLTASLSQIGCVV